jgi:hypothetical protein
VNAGQIIGALWTLTFWFLLISFFVLPVIFSYWRAREKAEQAATDATLKKLLHDQTHQFEQDAL